MILFIYLDLVYYYLLFESSFFPLKNKCNKNIEKKPR